MKTTDLKDLLKNTQKTTEKFKKKYYKHNKKYLDNLVKFTKTKPEPLRFICITYIYYYALFTHDVLLSQYYYHLYLFLL